MEDTIGDIWQRVIEGSHKDWERLITRFAPLVFSVVRRSGLDENEAEDCAQQVWIDLYKGRLTIQDPQGLPAWLIRVASRKAARIVKRLTKEREARGQNVITQTEPPADDELIRLERYAQLELALDQLDDRCRTLLRAVFYSSPECSYRDIAAELGIPLNSLGPTRSRCLKKLRKILTELGYL